MQEAGLTCAGTFFAKISRVSKWWKTGQTFYITPFFEIELNVMRLHFPAQYLNRLLTRIFI